MPVSIWVRKVIVPICGIEPVDRKGDWIDAAAGLGRRAVDEVDASSRPPVTLLLSSQEAEAIGHVISQEDIVNPASPVLVKLPCIQQYQLA